MNIRLRKIDTDPKAMSDFVGFGPQPCALRAFGALRAFVAYGRLWFVFWTQSEIHQPEPQPQPQLYSAFTGACQDGISALAFPVLR